MAEEKEYINFSNIVLTNFNVKEEFKDDSYIDVSETSLGANEIELKDRLRKDGILVDDIKIELPTFPTCNMNDNVKIEKDDNMETDDIKIKFDNDLFFCDHCKKYYEDYCTTCGMLAHILNRIPVNITDNKAIEEIPIDILEIRESSGHVGVFALKVIPENVKIGPFNGLSTSESPFRLKGGKFIVPNDKLKWLNWMQYINPAKNIFQQNLIPFQHENNLYYHSNREILAGEELLVYFGEEYEDSVNKGAEVDFIAPTEDDIADVFACTFCCLGFSSRLYLAKHKSSCPNETNRMLSIDELVQCPVCKNYFYEKEYLEFHKPYCNERDVRKCIPLSLANQTTKINRRKTQRLQIYSCTQCKYKTAYKADLKSHANKHYEVKEYRCEICYRHFKTKASLKLHVGKMHLNVEKNKDQKHSSKYNKKAIIKSKTRSSEVHRYLQNEECYHKCEMCDFKTRLKSSLGKHMKRKHLKEYSYECERCDYKANTKCNLVSHVKARHLKEFRYKCEICDYKTNKMSRLEVHIKSKHLKAFSYECEECDYKTNTKWSLVSHVNARHLKQFMYNCEICHYKTNQKSKLNSHKKSVHLKEFKHHCEICDYKTNELSKFRIHTKTKHLKEFTYKCEMCHFKTNDKTKFNIHKKSIHLLEFKHHCEICDYRTNDGLKFRIHVKTKHLNEFSYKCDKCDFKTNVKYTLQRHSKSKHLKKINYECEMYDPKAMSKAFSETYVEAKHLKEFSFECEMCEYKTNEKSHLEAHMKSRHKNISYECEICDYITNCELDFVNHMKLIHRAR